MLALHGASLAVETGSEGAAFVGEEEAGPSQARCELPSSNWDSLELYITEGRLNRRLAGWIGPRGVVGGEKNDPLSRLSLLSLVALPSVLLLPLQLLSTCSTLLLLVLRPSSAKRRSVHPGRRPRLRLFLLAPPRPARLLGTDAGDSGAVEAVLRVGCLRPPASLRPRIKASRRKKGSKEDEEKLLQPRRTAAAMAGRRNEREPPFRRSSMDCAGNSLNNEWLGVEKRGVLRRGGGEQRSFGLRSTRRME